MRVAFHFQMGQSQTFTASEQEFFRRLLRTREAELHVKLARGALVLPSEVRDRADLRAFIDRFFDPDDLRWASMQPSVLEANVTQAEVLVILTDGLSRKQSAT